MRSREAIIAEEIRRVVAAAVADGGILSIGDGVARIMAVCPPGLLKRQIGDELMMAAVAAGIAVEFGAPTRDVERDDLAA